MAETAAAPARSLAVPLVAFTVGAVLALVLGIIGKVHDPTLSGTTTLGFRTVIDMKTAVSMVIGLLVVLQLLGGLALYGRLGVTPPPWLGTVHRAIGGTAVVLSVFVAYHCLWSLGLESGTLKDGEVVPTRTVVHGASVT